MDSDTWDDAEYTVNRRREGAESFNVTLMPEYASRRVNESIQQHHSGEYLVLRPADRENKKSIELNFREALPNWSSQKRNTYLENSLQAHIISGYNEIDIQYPAAWEKHFAEQIDKRIMGLVDGVDDLSWNRETRVLTADSTDRFGSYAEHVSSFLYRQFMSTLMGDDDPYARSHQNMEKEIDAQWSQVTRISAEQLFELRREVYPRALNNLYVSNYLERLIDESQKVIERFEQFENTESAVAEYFCGEIAAICDSSSSLVDTDYKISLDIQVKEIAVQSYSLNVEFEDYMREQALYDKRLRALDEIKQKCLSLIEGESEDESQKGIAKTMIFVGEVVSTLRRILKIPRSIAFVGVAFRKIGEIHGMLADV